MKFKTYQGARAGIGDMMKALAAPGGNVYGDTMRDLAYVDSAQANARHADSETALNQQTYGAGERMMSPEMRAALDQLVPDGMDPGVYTTGWMASKNRTFDDFTKGFGQLHAGSAIRQALDAATRGDIDSMNRFNTVAQPGAQYKPFVMSEAGIIDQGTGAYTVSDLARARERQAAASANASNAHAGLYDAQRRAAGFMEVSPGASLYDLGGAGGGSSPVMDALGGIMAPPAGTMPDGRPIIRNPDGSVSTHEMATVTDPGLNGGQATLLPTIVNGQRMSVQDALSAALGAGGVDPTTGQPLASYASPEEAETDYLLRQHPQIDREASWRAQQGTGSAILGALPQGADLIPIATPGAQPAPIGTAGPPNPAGLQPLAAGGPRLVATAPSRQDVDKTAQREAVQIKRAMSLYGLSEADANALVRGWKRVVRDEVSGQTFIVDLATGKETALGGTSAPAQPQPGAVPSDGRPRLTPLWEQTSGVSGAVPAVKAALSGPASQVLGPEAAASDLIQSRQNFTNAKNDLMRAMSVNPRYPVGELQRLEREINIEPNAWDSDTTLRSKMVAVDSYLRNRLNTERAALADPSLPAEERKAAASAARNIENFLTVMGVPEGAAAAGESAGTAIQINDDADYDALPSGARFVGPDGVLRMKP